MTDNEKIHNILGYLYMTDNQSGFDSSQIAEAVNLSLAETNLLVRQIIDNGDAKGYNNKDSSAKGAIGLLKIVETKDAFEMKKYLKDSEKKFNLYFKAKMGPFNLMDFPESKLDIVIDAYKMGKKHFTVSGEKWWIENLQTIKIFTYEKDISLKDFSAYCEQKGLISRKSRSRYFNPKALALLGKDVTDEILGDLEFGEQTIAIEAIKVKGEFVNELRLDELRNIKNLDFDLTRLIRLCEEINDNFSRENYLSVGMIGRTILNHIPPIFRLKTFDQLTANYGGPKENKSFKKNMEHLNNSLINIADRYLHQTIRKQETLPNETQVDFRQDLDVLLEEIVRILKN